MQIQTPSSRHIQCTSIDDPSLPPSIDSDGPLYAPRFDQNLRRMSIPRSFSDSILSQRCVVNEEPISSPLLLSRPDHSPHILHNTLLALPQEKTLFAPSFYSFVSAFIFFPIWFFIALIKYLFQSPISIKEINRTYASIEMIKQNHLSHQDTLKQCKYLLKILERILGGEETKRSFCQILLSPFVGLKTELKTRQLMQDIQNALRFSLCNSPLKHRIIHPSYMPLHLDPCKFFTKEKIPLFIASINFTLAKMNVHYWKLEKGQINSSFDSLETFLKKLPSNTINQWGIRELQRILFSIFHEFSPKELEIFQRRVLQSSSEFDSSLLKIMQSYPPKVSFKV